MQTTNNELTPILDYLLVPYILILAHKNKNLMIAGFPR